MTKPGGPFILDACPSCGAPDSVVKDSRPVPGYPTWRRRRRACGSMECGARWWTVELPEESLMAARVTLPELRVVLEDTIGMLTKMRERLMHEEPSPALED